MICQLQSDLSTTRDNYRQTLDSKETLDERLKEMEAELPQQVQLLQEELAQKQLQLDKLNNEQESLSDELLKCCQDVSHWHGWETDYLRTMNCSFRLLLSNNSNRLLKVWSRKRTQKYQLSENSWKLGGLRRIVFIEK